MSESPMKTRDHARKVVVGGLFVVADACSIAVVLVAQYCWCQPQVAFTFQPGAKTR
jgi:hypothetical protein